MTSKEVIRLLNKDGWCLVRQTGSHKQFRHPLKQGVVTVPDHAGVDLKPKTLSSIEKQSGVALVPKKHK